MLGKIEGQEKKAVTEDEMVGWHHRLSGKAEGRTFKRDAKYIFKQNNSKHMEEGTRVMYSWFLWFNHDHVNAHQ